MPHQRFLTLFSRITIATAILFSSAANAADLHWAQSITEGDKLFNESKSEEARRIYQRALENLPKSEPELTKARIAVKIANTCANKSSLAIEHLETAVKIYGKLRIDSEKNPQNQTTNASDLEIKNAIASEEIDAIAFLSFRLSSIHENEKACSFMAQAIPLIEKLDGKHLRMADHLVHYAGYLLEAGEAEKSNNAITSAIALCDQENSLEEKRKRLTLILIQIAAYYHSKADWNNVEKYYKQAIYAGESLWYPSYGWSMIAMDEYKTFLQKRGRVREAEKLQKRLERIDDTGKDPEGKNVSKYWNHQKEPADTHRIGIGHRVKKK